MKNFIKNASLFLVPFLIYLSIISLVDPFDYFNVDKWISDGEKEEVALEVEPHLFKINHFYNEPKPNIVLGDSRSNGLYEVMDKDRWGNLAYGGGTIKEVVQSFWWADQVSDLDTVLIGINLNLYNKFNKRFWVEETLSRRGNLVSYAFNSYTFKSTVELLNTQLFDNPTDINEVKVSKEQFWNSQLQGTKKFYEKMEYPDEYYQHLWEISDYCLKNGVKLIFWIPPTHVEYQEKLEVYDLEAYEKRFVQDLRTLGDVWDFNYNSSLTRDKENFYDPMHFTFEIGKLLHKEITTASRKLGRMYKYTDLDPDAANKKQRNSPII